MCEGAEPIRSLFFQRYPPGGDLLNVDGKPWICETVTRLSGLSCSAASRCPVSTKDWTDGVNFNMGNDHGTTTMAIRLATINHDPKASQPMMDYLFSRTWDYPLPLSGIQDYIVTGTTRDGTTSIGSFFYTAGGSPFLPVADMITTYIENGGDRKYNLADPAHFPKPFFGAYFNLDGRVAGYWPLGVGDVGGLLSYGHGLDYQSEAVRLGWKYLRDPRLAWIVKFYHGRKSESDAEWQALEQAAANQSRNPWMDNKSRALASWSGILESGTQHDDYRFKRAVTLRVGVGHGHAHNDTLDLQMFAFGLQMSPDGGQRPNYGRPECQLSMTHNVVEVDGDGNREGDWQGHSWIRTLSDIPGARMMQAKAIPPSNKSQVRLAERTVALIDVDEGEVATQYPSDLSLRPGTVYSKDIVLPNSYVVDFYRVAGGKRHTYCFHGCADDPFEVNATNQTKVPLKGVDINPPKSVEATDNLEVSYLRKYVLEGFQGAGEVPKDGTVVASWRVGREPYTFETKSSNVEEGKTKTYRCPAPEPHMYGVNYDPQSPRKYTRLHLLDQAGARVLWGRWVSAPYTSNSGQWVTNLHVMHGGDKDRESVFAGVIETHAGETFIESVASMRIQKNEENALRAMAIEVNLKDGQRHFVFQDGRPDQMRTVSAKGVKFEVSAQYAFIATDALGLKQASVSGARVLDVPGLIKIEPAVREYTAHVNQINHPSRQIDVPELLPEALIGHSFWDVGNTDHRTSLEVLSLKQRADRKGTSIKFRKGLEIVSTRVRNVDTESGIVTGKLVSIEMGTEEDNGMKTGMTRGLWASNESVTKWWRCEYIGGNRSKGFDYKLTGTPVTSKDFPIGGAIRIWELGATDDLRLSTWASVRRDPRNDEGFIIESNVALKLALPVSSRLVEVSSDRLEWKESKGDKRSGLFEFQLDESQLGNGKAYIRAGK